MERRYLLRLLTIGVGVVVAIVWFFSISQVHHLQKLVIEGNQRTSELQHAVNRLQDTIAQGGGVRASSDADGASDNFLRPYFSQEEWKAFTAPDNLLTTPSSPVRVAGGVAGGVLQRAFVSDLPSLNPLTSNAADVANLYAYISEGLAGRDPQHPENLVPGLAYRIEANDDFTAFHIWLRHDVKWQRPPLDLSSPQYAWLKGPHEVVADDFVFGMELVMNPQVNAAFLRNYYDKFKGIDVINDHEFIVHWSEPQYTNQSATIGIPPIPRWLYGYDRNGNPFDKDEVGKKFNDHWFNQYAIGAGAFRFVQWKKGGRVRIERNPTYYGQQPYLAGIDFRVISDATARLNNLRAGTLDYIPIEPTEYKNQILDGGTPGFQNGTLHHKIFDGPIYRYLGWNEDSQYFGDRRVRLAMTMAFNRKLTIQKNMHGLGIPITGPFPVSNPAYDHSIKPWPFDLDRAAELLTKAGWVDRDGDGIREKTIDGRIVPFRFRMLTYAHRPEIMAAMQIFQSDLRKIGVKMELVPAEWSVYLQRLNDKDFDAYTGGWSLGWETDLYQLWHSSQADVPHSSNRIGFRNAAADKIIEKVRVTFDDDKRNALFHKFHALVHKEQPYTFWFQIRNVGAWRDRVHNVEFSKIRPLSNATRWYIQEAPP